MLNKTDQIILQTVIESKKPVSNGVLAILCGVSINTVRKEIKILNEELKTYGVCLVSKSSVGNYLEITDPKKKEQNLQNLHVYLKRSKSIKIYENVEVYYLMRKFLCSGVNLSMENICQEMHCSHSTLMREIKIVRKMLRKYNLSLSSKGRESMKIMGKEWDIRQCLIYQHKIYKNISEVEKGNKKEYAFKSLFYEDGTDNYNVINNNMISLLREQNDFFIPYIHFPKIIHYIQLSMSRQKYSGKIYFTNEQVDKVLDTKEYTLTCKLCDKVEGIMGRKILEIDRIGAAMLFLSYETKNMRLYSEEGYQNYKEETNELIRYLIKKWGYNRDLFDDDFVKNWICFLYTLDNQILFGTYPDGECVESMKKQGINSVDLCLAFARFYEKRHRICLDRDAVLSAGFIFHGVLTNKDGCYYSQNILVLSQHGYASAMSLAQNVRCIYDKEIGIITPVECYEYVENIRKYDLIVTDIEKGDRLSSIRKYYNLPILSVEFQLGSKQRYVELDEYFSRIKISCQMNIIKNENFHKTAFSSQEEILLALTNEIEKSWGGYKRKKVFISI